MLKNWPLLFIIIPLVELYFIIAVGEQIGAFWTIVLVLLTAFVGVRLLRYQGLSTLARAQQSMAQGTIPAQEMMEGMALAIGGVFLITPGFITDALGFLCLIPATRQIIVKFIMARVSINMSGHMGGAGMGGQSHQPGNDDGFIDGSQQRQVDKEKSDLQQKSGRVIEGEYRKED